MLLENNRIRPSFIVTPLGFAPSGADTPAASGEACTSITMLSPRPMALRTEETTLRTSAVLGAPFTPAAGVPWLNRVHSPLRIATVSGSISDLVPAVSLPRRRPPRLERWRPRSS
jgi:hypothetical protein